MRAAALAVLLSAAASAQPTASALEAPPTLAVSLDGVTEVADGYLVADGVADGRFDRAAVADSTAPPDDWIAYDKALHLGASFLLTLSAQYVLTDKTSLSDGRAMPVAAGSALALGLLKEVADSQRERHPLFSWRDLAVDAVGVALGVAVIEL